MEKYAWRRKFTPRRAPPCPGIDAVCSRKRISREHRKSASDRFRCSSYRFEVLRDMARDACRVRRAGPTSEHRARIRTSRGENMNWPPNNQAILEAIHGLFDSGQWWIYKGDAVRELERAFADAHASRYGVSVCNGTVALEVVLRALGIGSGDKVVLPAYDYYSLPKSVSNV